MLKKLIIGMVLAVIVVFGLLWYLSQGIEDVSLERFDFAGVTQLTEESLVVEGTLHVHNPSDLPVPVQNITYDVFLGDEQEKIGSAVISGFLLEATSTSTTSIDQEIFFEETTTALTNLLQGDSDTITIQGELFIDVEVHTQSIPFSETTTLQEQIISQAREPIDDDSILDPLDNII